MILYRYITREFVKPFLYSLSTVMLMFVMQLAINLLPKVLYKGIPATVILELFAVNLAHIAVLSVPMSVLIAMLMVFGKFTGDNELAAIKAGGHSVVALLPPVVAISGVLAVIMLFFNTAVLPQANHHGSTLLSDIMKKKPAAMIEPGVLIKDFAGYAIMVDSVEHETGSLFGIKIFSEVQGNKPSITVAKSGTIFMSSDESQVQLTLHNGETHRQGSNNKKEHYRINFETQVVYIKNVDSDLKHTKDKNKGDREKTNDILLKEVKDYQKSKDNLHKQHRDNIDKMLVFVDSLHVPDTVAEETINNDSLIDSTAVDVVQEKSVATDVVQKKTGNESDTTLASVSNDSLIDSTKNSVVIGTDTISKNPLDIRSSAHTELLSRIEESGRGRRISRIFKSELTRARLRVERIQKEKKKINGHLVEVHKKYALAISVIVFALLGVPLGIVSRSGSVAISVSYSLFFYIVYYAFLVSGEKLSEKHGLHPGIAMWMGNIVLFILSMFLIARSARESSLINWDWLKILFKPFIYIKNLPATLAKKRADDENSGKISFFSILFKAFKQIVFFPATIIRIIMPALPGYILGRFFSFFFSVSIGLTVLTVVIDYISVMNRLEGALPMELVMYYLYFMAWFFSIVLPMALLLATMMTIGSFAKTNELTAIKASGISMVKMTIPLLLVGLFFSVFSFYFAEQVLPESNKRKTLLKEVFSARRNNREIPTAKKSYKHDFYYFSDPLTAYRFTHFQTFPARGDKVIRYRFGEGTLLETTEIKKMIYEDTGWTMISGIKRDFTTNEYVSERFTREADVHIKDSPEEMVQSVGSTEQLSYSELKSILEKAKQRGEDVSRYEADLSFKFALPLMNFIVILIGVAVTARSDKRGGAVHFGAGMGLVASYWAISQFLLVFGRSGQLSPQFAAWSGTVLFLIIGLALYRKASQ